MSNYWRFKPFTDPYNWILPGLVFRISEAVALTILHPACAMRKGMCLFFPRKCVHMPSSGSVMYTSGRIPFCDPLTNSKLHCWTVLLCFAFCDVSATVPAVFSRSVRESCTVVLPLAKRTMAVKYIIYNWSITMPVRVEMN